MTAKGLKSQIAVITVGHRRKLVCLRQTFVKEGAYVFITGRRHKDWPEAVEAIGTIVYGVQGDIAPKLADLERPLLDLFPR